MSAASSLNQLFFAVQQSLSSISSCFCQQDATLKLNGRNLKIGTDTSPLGCMLLLTRIIHTNKVKLLGEGGFSYVYLARDPSSGRLFALKKIRCPLGSDSVKEAIKEVEAYKRFRHPNIIRCLDSCVVQDKDGDGKVVYVFLPYYSKGNLQDLVNLHTDLTPIPEREILRYFLGTAQAVAAMHRHVPRTATVSDSYPPNGHDLESPAGAKGTSVHGTTDRKGKGRQSNVEEDLEEEDDERMMGGTEAEQLEEPLMANHLSDHNHQNHLQASHRAHPPSSNEIEPWAHRDLKPANVMISDDDQPILMDFGSALKARIPVPNRSIALQQQDLAAEHSSMPYRAPELFDVKTGEDLTEAVDIWSLGSLLYCLGYGHSPFETTDTVEQGGSMALAVMNGSWKFPNTSSSSSSNPNNGLSTKNQRVYSDGFMDLIKSMLVLDPKSRPNISGVIQSAQALVDHLDNQSTA